MPTGWTRFASLALSHELKCLNLPEAFVDTPAHRRGENLGRLDDPIRIDQELTTDIDAGVPVIDSIHLAKIPRTVGHHRERDAAIDHLGQLLFVPDLVDEHAVDADRDDLDTELFELIEPVSDR